MLSPRKTMRSPFLKKNLSPGSPADSGTASSWEDSSQMRTQVCHDREQRDEPSMRRESDSKGDAGGQRERMAAELRACRESQQGAWGDIDNTPLGRYLAGEVDGTERQQV